MPNVDNRVVQMQFDNTAFERKMATTLTSLQKLNTTLSTIGAKNGLDQVSASARSFSLGTISASVDGISAKFLAMSTIAITALSQITTRAISAGAQIIKSLSLDQVTAGFAEYELQIGSIQTILSNTKRDGTNLEQVSAALDELNTYADQTIYNFASMTQNIGAFTAAGIDLDTSVTSIQGIANLAAISGSNAEQASTAMYQLSQAMATGTVRLMDWKSVENAGMGGELFQRALFDTGVAMGTIVDTPVGTTFEEWKDAGNTFRGSLEDGWLSAEVLTTTLGGLSGQMTEAQLVAMGFSAEVAQDMLELGQTGIEAATKVRTFSQLMTTVKESISSGWASSFRIIFGDFEQATALFTHISEAIGGIVGRSADSRNAVLQEWSDMGGRTRLIYAFGSSFKSLGLALKPIRDAFKQVFGSMDADRLFDLTVAFQHLSVAIRPSGETANNVRRIFKGFFSILEIGWTIIKEGIGFIKDLIVGFTGLGNGNLLGGLAKIADFFTMLNQKLVGGGGIADFFDGLTEKIQPAIAKIKEITAIAIAFFKALDIPDVAGKVFQRIQAFAANILKFFSKLKLPSGLGEFFGQVGNLFSSIAGGASAALSGAAGGLSGMWEPFKNALGGIAGMLDGAWESIKDFFGNLGSKIASVMSAPDFSAVLDTIDTGLLGGIAVLLAKFLGGGVNLDFGGGFFKNISDAVGELSGTLQAMQMNLKANALLKIAGAIGILAVALLLLASIEPDKLSDALAALAIGFGQLIGAFAILNQMGLGPKSAASMNLIATSLILLSAAILILVVAMKLMSTMTWEEIAKGLVGIAGALLLLVGAAFALSKVQGSMIRVGIGLIAVALALAIMAGVVKLFSMMRWDEILKGLAGIGGALVAVAIGMRLMPKGMLAQGAGLLLIGVALLAIAGAMKIMATMSWEDMAKGLVGIAGALVGIGLATKLMGPSLIFTAAGLLLLSIALAGIVGVMQLLAMMSWGDIAKGLVGITGALLGIGIAMLVANGSLGGAAALTIMVFALGLLVDVIKEVGSMPISVLITGVVGIAGALVVLALASLLLAPAILPMLGFGAALLLIGGAFALFGVGVLSLAKGFELLTKVGMKGVKVLIDGFEKLAAALPGFLGKVAEGVLKLIQTILDGLPAIIDQIIVIVGKILDGLIELIPKAAEAIRTLITELLATIRLLFPDFVATGFELILALLTGIRDNIGEIVTVVAEIITEFLDAMTAKIDEVIDSMYNFFIAVIEGVVSKLVDIGELLVPKGLELIKGLLKGLDENKEEIGNFFKELPGKILGWIGDAALWLLEKGGEIIGGLLSGASGFFTGTVLPWIGTLPGLIFSGIGSLVSTLASRGRTLISGFYSAATTFVTTYVIPWLKALPGKIFSWIGSTVSTLASRGRSLISGFYSAASTFVTTYVIPFMTSLPGKIFNWIGSTVSTLASRGRTLISGFYSAASTFVTEFLMPWIKSLPGLILGWIGSLSETLVYRGGRLIAGLYNGIIGMVNELLIPWFGSLGSKVLSFINDLSSTLAGVGRAIIQGLWDGMTGLWDDVAGWLGDRASEIVDIFDAVWVFGSPSKTATTMGANIFIGLHNGMQTQWTGTERWLNRIDPEVAMSGFAAKMTHVIQDVAEQIGQIDEFTPTITPVLDLTMVQAGAKTLSSLLANDTAYLQAAGIARSALPGASSPTSPETARGEVRFEQNIYAPEQLSTSDIYRNTRNQIAMAKEELDIP